MSAKSLQDQGERIIGQGKIVELVEFTVNQAGKELRFEKARRSPGVRFIVTSDEEILLTREHRHEHGGYDFRLPGGKVFDTLGEYTLAREAGADLQAHAQAAGIKEVRQEAGVTVHNVEFFHKSVCGTTVEWDLFYFTAESKEQTDVREFDEGEDITTHFFTKDEVRQMCLDGRINEERSALILLRFLNS